MKCLLRMLLILLCFSKNALGMDRHEDGLRQYELHKAVLLFNEPEFTESKSGKVPELNSQQWQEYCACKAERLAKMLSSKPYNVNAVDLLGRTPLHYAAKSGLVSCIKLLLEEGANPNLKTPAGYTPLDFAVREGKILCVKEFIRSESIRIETVLDAFSRGIDARATAHKTPRKTWERNQNGMLKSPDDSAYSKIDLCCYQILHSQKLASLKLEDKEKLMKVYCGGTMSHPDATYAHRYPLHAAAQEICAGVTHQGQLLSNRDRITECLKTYAVDSLDDKGNTALLYAVTNNYPDSVACLLQAGAQLQRDKALFIAAQMPRKGTNQNPNMPLNLLKQKEEIFDLLIKYGADINAKNEHGDSLLHIALRDLQDDAARILIEKYKANINDTNADGDTLLHVAAAAGDIATIRHLVKEFKADINSKNAAGDTLIHMAARAGKIEIIRTLVEEFNADLYEQNNDGNTVMHLAAMGRSDKQLVIELETLERGVRNKNSHIKRKHPTRLCNCVNNRNEKPSQVTRSRSTYDFLQKADLSGSWGVVQHAQAQELPQPQQTSHINQSDLQDTHPLANVMNTIGNYGKMIWSAVWPKTSSPLTTATPVPLTTTTTVSSEPQPSVVEHGGNGDLTSSQILNTGTEHAHHGNTGKGYQSSILQLTPEDLERLNREFDAQSVDEGANDEDDVVLNTTQPVTAASQNVSDTKKCTLNTREFVRIPRIKNQVMDDQQADNFHLIFSEQNQVPAVPQHGNNPDPKLEHHRSFIVPIAATAACAGLICIGAKKLYGWYYQEEPEDTDKSMQDGQESCECADMPTEAALPHRAL